MYNANTSLEGLRKMLNRKILCLRSEPCTSDVEAAVLAIKSKRSMEMNLNGGLVRICKEPVVDYAKHSSGETGEVRYKLT
jgi:hypothetical protein